MAAGYSGTPLIKKLGIKPDQAVAIINPPERFFDLLGPLPDGAIVVEELEAGMQFIQFFTKSTAELTESFDNLKNHLDNSGMLWISWPKKSSSIKSDLNGNIIRKVGLGNGLVDVKVCAIDEDWSGLKFMYRTKDRK